MDKFKNLFKSEFARNVLTLMTGTVLAQAIPIAISPILTRIYTPEDFGVLSLFMAICAILGTVINAKYEKAIVMPKDDKDAVNLVVLGFMISTCLSFLFLLFIFFFEDFIVRTLDSGEIRIWLYFIPLTTFFLGIYNVLTYYNIREKKFKNISKSLVVKSTSLASIQLLIGFIKSGVFGLLIGFIFSSFFGNAILLRVFKRKSRLRLIKDNYDFQYVKRLAGEHKKFPLYSMPAIFLNSASINIINFIISSLFSLKILGFYSLTQRVVAIPSAIIGNSFSQVYFQKATVEYNNNGNTKYAFKASLRKLIYVGLPIFLIIYLVAEPIFAFIFGEEWRISGVYARTLVPLAFFRYLYSALSMTPTIHRMQQIGLYVNIILVIAIGSIYFIAKIGEYSFVEMLNLFVIILSLVYLSFLFTYWRISRN